MSCGPWCVYYKDKGKTSACFNCSYFVPFIAPRFELGKVDIFKLAEGLAEKEQRAKRQDKSGEDDAKDKLVSGIECGSTGRRFESLDAIEECCKSHNHCTTCPYKQNQSNSRVHFVAKDRNSLTQLELNKLMDDINAHIKARRLAVPQSVLVTRERVTAQRPRSSPPFKPKRRGRRADWIWISLLLIAFALIVVVVVLSQSNL